LKYEIEIWVIDSMLLRQSGTNIQDCILNVKKKIPDM